MSQVVDASIVITLLANPLSEDLLRRRLSGADDLHAPHLIDAEVASGVRGLVLGGKVEPDRASQMLGDFADLAITRHPMLPYLPRVMELRHNFTAYDACYVAVAEATGAPLLTRDRKFDRSAGHRADIQVYR